MTLALLGLAWSFVGALRERLKMRPIQPVKADSRAG